MQRVDLPGVAHGGVLPVVGADARGRGRDGRGGPARAVPAGLPDRARPRLLPEHGRVRAPRRPAARRHQPAPRLALRQLSGLLHSQCLRLF
jgi:hypothetical protein